MNSDQDQIRGKYKFYVTDKCVCQYCGFDGKRSPEDWVQLQIDHLIPRNIAGDDQEDPLNQVVACYYCNTQKKDFDPSYGVLTKVPTQEARQELITVAREYLSTKKDRMWSNGGGLEGSFSHMMEDISG